MTGIVGVTDVTVVLEELGVVCSASCGRATVMVTCAHAAGGCFVMLLFVCVVEGVSYKLLGCIQPMILYKLFLNVLPVGTCTSVDVVEGVGNVAFADVGKNLKLS